MDQYNSSHDCPYQIVILFSEAGDYLAILTNAKFMKFPECSPNISQDSRNARLFRIKD